MFIVLYVNVNIGWHIHLTFFIHRHMHTLSVYHTLSLYLSHSLYHFLSPSCLHVPVRGSAAPGWPCPGWWCCSSGSPERSSSAPPRTRPAPPTANPSPGGHWGSGCRSWDLGTERSGSGSHSLWLWCRGLKTSRVSISAKHCISWKQCFVLFWKLVFCFSSASPFFIKEFLCWLAQSAHCLNTHTKAL